MVRTYNSITNTLYLPSNGKLKPNRLLAQANLAPLLTDGKIRQVLLTKLKGPKNLPSRTLTQVARAAVKHATASASKVSDSLKYPFAANHDTHILLKEVVNEPALTSIPWQMGATSACQNLAAV